MMPGMTCLTQTNLPMAKNAKDFQDLAIKATLILSILWLSLSMVKVAMLMKPLMTSLPNMIKNTAMSWRENPRKMLSDRI